MKEKHNRINNGINYCGEVSITVMDGKRKLYTIVHNNGKKGLFTFLSNCLLGNFTAAKNSYPSKIACFGTATEASTTLIRLSSFVRYDSSRWEAKETSTESSIYFHFRIPYMVLKHGTITTLRLYTNDVSGEEVESDICAEIKLKDTEYITVPDTTDGNFTIIVDWKMTFKDISSDAEATSTNSSSTDDLNNLQVGDLKVTQTNYDTLTMYLTDADVEALGWPETKSRDIPWLGGHTEETCTFKIIGETDDYYIIDSKTFAFIFHDIVVNQFAIKKEFFENIRYVSNIQDIHLD